jgi:hypothetical protein
VLKYLFVQRKQTARRCLIYKKAACIVSFYLLLVLTSAALSAPYPGRLGINIGLGERGGTFVDLVKENYRWQEPVTFDSEGWPTCDTLYIADYRPVAEWDNNTGIDDPEEYRVDMSGTYKCSFNGLANVSTWTGGSVQNKTYNLSTNTTTFDLVVPGPMGADDWFLMLNFSSTRRTSSSSTDTGFTNFKMIRPGYPADTTQTFTNELVNCITSADFGFIRYKDFTCADGADPVYPETTEWSDRKLTTDASQVPLPAIGKTQGGAWEYVIELANLTGKDIWVNPVVSASTDYVTQLATMLKNNLNPSIKIYVESSNEVWNTADPFSVQNDWNLAQANALGINEHANHARRTVELSQIFASVFGQSAINDRVRVMLCSHEPMLKWWVQTFMIPYINSEFGPPGDYIYGLGCQLYFGAPDIKPDNRTIDQLLDDCIDNIDSKMDEPAGNEAGRIQWVAKAAEWNLTGGFCSYEGGYGTPCCGSPDNIPDNLDNKILMHRVPRAADVLKYNYDDGFFALGGNLATQFTMTSAYTRYGCWGLTDDVNYPERNYKFQAARDLTNIRGDFDSDGDVDLLDLAQFAQQWLALTGPADFDNQNGVNLTDFATLAENWL